MPGDACGCRENMKGFMAFSTEFHAYTPKLLIFGIQKKPNTVQNCQCLQGMS